MLSQRHPVRQFVVGAVLVLAVVLVATDWLSARAARTQAILDARAKTELLALTVGDQLPEGLVDTRNNSDAVFATGQLMEDKVLGGDVRRVKIWRSDGTVLYSDQPIQIDRKYTLGEDEQKVLAEGGSDAEVADLSREENRYEPRDAGQLVEVGTKIYSPEGVPLLLEVSYSAHDIDAHEHQVLGQFRPIALLGVLALFLVTLPLVWGLGRRLDRAARAREDLLRAAVAASTDERRRIATDLNDVVVRDLEVTAADLGRLAREDDMPARHATVLRRAGDELGEGVRALRTLLVEIYPPNLDAAGLPEALEDLVLAAADRGVRATVEVSGIDGAAPERVALVWRTAREAVRNTVRHARASRLDVQVRGEGKHLVLRVADDGVGFVPGAVRRGGLGLRGVRHLVGEAGGTLDVESGPGRGTTIRMRVGAR